MSDFFARVVEIGAIEKHLNADSLSITKVYDGYPVIFNHTTHPLMPGMKAVYITVDALLPLDRFEFAFLRKGESQTYHRLRASKIRQIFSMGLLIPCDQRLAVDTDMLDALEITKYEPPVQMSTGGECERDPGFLPIYTDLESLRKHKDLIAEGTEVLITEKLHGANARYLFKDGRLWVGSHKQIKAYDASNMWWKVAEKYDLAKRLADFEGLAFYGEVFGQVQDLKYGTKTGELRLAIFDILDTKTYRYLDAAAMLGLCIKAGLDFVPVLYQGPWKSGAVEHAEGKSTLAEHIREGFVVRPIQETTAHIGRVVLKMVGESYLTRKEKAA